MITLNDLHAGKGSRKSKKRVGRGTGSGLGCTAGYGMNGAKARSGDKYKAYFEGGQTPLIRRIGKRGFNNRNRVEYQVINVGRLAQVITDEKEIDPTWLAERGLIGKAELPVKVLGQGDFDKAIVIKADAFSKSAREKIEQAKGKAEERTSA